MEKLSLIAGKCFKGLGENLAEKEIKRIPEDPVLSMEYRTGKELSQVPG